MPDRFVKVFESILDSSIWFEDSDTRCVWLTLMALADADGNVENTLPGLARRALPKLDLDEAMAITSAALQKFQDPDEYSRTPDYEGRRIAPIEGGWHLLNHAKYREKRRTEERKAQNRASQARRRQRQKADGQQESAKSAQAEAEEEAEADTQGLRPSWVSVVRIFGDTHPWCSGMLDAHHHERDAKSIWRRLGEDEAKVRAASEAHAGNAWVVENKAGLQHFAKHLEKYADNGKPSGATDAERARIERELVTLREQLADGLPVQSQIDALEARL